MKKVFVPPIKSQGIKTKLVPRIRQAVQSDENGKWVEPFMGTGVVGFNMRPKHALFVDSNPHIINFYQAINNGQITPAHARAYLENEGRLLAENGDEHYYRVRKRFNQTHAPLDFLFLSRAGFNGMIRFNQKGRFNVPFNHKPERFSPAYVTKVVNQVQYVFDLCRMNEYTFVCQDFRDTFEAVQANDFVYCDPPYMGRHVDYFSNWNAQDEEDLFQLLATCKSKFILSTWHSNQHRNNPAILSLEGKYHVVTHEHFYHVGARETNRKPVLEALVMNYHPSIYEPLHTGQYRQAALLETKAAYQQDKE
ncbi:MAG: Dam family site-specific DNA-(adenine-N6)-methyltransferase [Ardenticatenaceae bacterium]|nr:Dam family site-specific DNA-(adenine-N6)-methyltransferase [Ardenticatenaceae bacterium]MCB9442843.1 Dam family site-specific DNA-(adenine-N6)-methyltransferase [Ardenticatenaceae bacterium]